jgi:imidazoleglycerol-phosphate dehydratase
MISVPSFADSLSSRSRRVSVSRATQETDVQVTIDLDGQGHCYTSTGVPFLDHMLHQIASHGLIDLDVRATGDIEIDDHHTNEDVGITLGQALAKALGEKKGIVATSQLWLTDPDSTGGNLRYPVSAGIFRGLGQS